MQQSITPDKNITLNEAKNHFDQWRTTRKKRRGTPDSLWREVESLAGHYSLSQITQTLGVNTNQLSQELHQKK
jgi:hypothetical protein